MMDIRKPIGWLFSTIGLLLLGRGLLGELPAASVQAGFNINAWWGALLGLFGAAMLALARRRSGARAGRQTP